MKLEKNDKLLSWDIETTSITKHAHELPPSLYDEWKHIVSRKLDIPKEGLTTEQIETYWERNAPLYSTFSKIVCISFAYFYDKDYVVPPQIVNGYPINGINIKTISGDEEHIVEEAIKIFNNSNNLFKHCGINLKNYDIPFFARKCNKYGFKVPYFIQKVINEKWKYDMFLFDPQEYWGFGSFSNKYVRLGRICYELGVPTPKTEFDGADVYHILYGNKEGDITDIIKYCERDVISTLICSEIINQINN